LAAQPPRKVTVFLFEQRRGGQWRNGAWKKKKKKKKKKEEERETKVSAWTSDTQRATTVPQTASVRPPQLVWVVKTSMVGWWTRWPRWWWWYNQGHKISLTGRNDTDTVRVAAGKRQTMLVFVAYTIHGEQLPPATVQMHLAVLVFFPSTVHMAHNSRQGLPWIASVV
jgi:hypothetical protein